MKIVCCTEARAMGERAVMWKRGTARRAVPSGSGMTTLESSPTWMWYCV